MATKMESLFSELAEYFVFDAQKYTLEEFMSDIKTFKNQFKVKLRNTIEKLNRGEKVNQECGQTTAVAIRKPD
jgi:diaphanous 2